MYQIFFGLVCCGISNIEGLYFKYLRQTKSLLMKSEKKVPEQLLYYLKE